MGIASLGIDLAMISMGFGLVWIHPVSPGKAELISIVLMENRPDLGEFNLLAKDVITTISPVPNKVFLPWSTHDHSLSAWKWQAVWESGNDIYIQCFPCESPLKEPLGSGNISVISPLLNSVSGALNIAVLFKDEKKLKLLRVEQGKENVTPKFSWPHSWPINHEPFAAKVIPDRKVQTK